MVSAALPRVSNVIAPWMVPARDHRHGRHWMANESMNPPTFHLVIPPGLKHDAEIAHAVLPGKRACDAFLANRAQFETHFLQAIANLAQD